LKILVYKEDRTKLGPTTREEHPTYTIFPVTSFSVNHNKTHKSRLKYEIKCDLYKVAQNFENLKTWTFEISRFKNL